MQIDKELSRAASGPLGLGLGLASGPLGLGLGLASGPLGLGLGFSIVYFYMNMVKFGSF